jgi:hypothetical protein
MIAGRGFAPTPDGHGGALDRAAQAIGQQLIMADVRSEREIESAFAAFVQSGAGRFLVGAGGLTAPTDRVS